MNAGIKLVAKVFVGLQQDLEEAREVFFAEDRCSAFQSRTLIRRRRDQIGVGATNASDEQVADVANRLTAEVLKVAAFFLKAVDESECAISRSGCDGVNELFERVFGNDTEELANFFCGNGVAAIGARLLQ